MRTHGKATYVSRCSSKLRRLTANLHLDCEATHVLRCSSTLRRLTYRVVAPNGSYLTVELPLTSKWFTCQVAARLWADIHVKLRPNFRGDLRIHLLTIFKQLSCYFSARLWAVFRLIKEHPDFEPIYLKSCCSTLRKYKCGVAARIQSQSCVKFQLDIQRITSLNAIELSVILRV